MGRRIVEVDPELIQEIFTQDHVIGESHIVRVVEGIPHGAKIVRCWVKQEVQPHGVFVILFESEEWSETPKGEPYQHVEVMIRSEYPERTP